MSSLRPSEMAKFEKLLQMGGGYVLEFNNHTFSQFFDQVVEIDIDADVYFDRGASKANRLRCFCSKGNDNIVGKVLVELVDMATTTSDSSDIQLVDDCKKIGQRLQEVNTGLEHLRSAVEEFDSEYISKQIHRMEQAVNTDPSLAIGTAKELIETCCKSILKECGVPDLRNPKMSTLTKATLKGLSLVPESIPDTARGEGIIKSILGNLAMISSGLTELRGLYGSGHGKPMQSQSLYARHAKLATGSAAVFVTFLFETHKVKKRNK
jgi:hypothetical protein